MTSVSVKVRLIDSEKVSHRIHDYARHARERTYSLANQPTGQVVHQKAPIGITDYIMRKTYFRGISAGTIHIITAKLREYDFT